MMKIKLGIYGGEAFPVYSVHNEDSLGEPIEVDRVTYERWKKTFCEFQNVQGEVIEAMQAAGHDTWGQSDQARLWDEW